MVFLGFSSHSWIKFEYLEKEKRKFNLKKVLNSAYNLKYKSVLKSGIWPKFHRKMGMKIGVNNTGTKLSFFWTQINQIQTTYSYSARRDLSIGAWFDHIWRKIILVNFCGKGPPFGLKNSKKIFVQKRSYHAPIERFRPAE